MGRITFVIPSFNEEESLVELMRQLDKVILENNYNAEVIFIDDGSTDGSFRLMKELQGTYTYVRAVQFRRNSGKAMALSAGFKRAQGDIVVMMDADLQDDPKDVPRLIEQLEQGFDAVTGWKVNRKDPWHKVIPSRVINAIVRWMYGLKIHDLNCGLKAFNKDVIHDVPVYGELYRYILILAHSRGYKVTEIPTTHHSRQFGYSKFGISRFFKGFTDLFTVFFLTKFEKRPLHFFGGVGSIFSLIGFFILLYLVVVKIAGQSIGDRPLLLFGVLFVLVGLQLAATGFIGELLVAQRPNIDPPVKKEI